MAFYLQPLKESGIVGTQYTNEWEGAVPSVVAHVVAGECAETIFLICSLCCGHYPSLSKMVVNRWVLLLGTAVPKASTEIAGPRKAGWSPRR